MKQIGVGIGSSIIIFVGLLSIVSFLGNDQPTVQTSTTSPLSTTTAPLVTVTEPTSTASGSQPQPTESSDPHMNLPQTHQETEPVPVADPTPLAVPPTTTESAAPAPPPLRSFTENFGINFTLVEAEHPSASTHPHWWVSSGAYLFSTGGIGSTVTGSLRATDERYINYQTTNPSDSDRGQHPQNIFRLVQTDRWYDSVQEASFKILDTNYSSSPNRNASNGLLFFIHYQDEFNLYYAGVRVDGAAVIKKKINGDYYTLALEPAFGPASDYSRTAKVNLLPQDSWVRLRTIVREAADGTVSIALYRATLGTNNWELLVRAVDNGKSFGGPVFTSGSAGIRTDFMDVQFDDYFISEL